VVEVEVEVEVEFFEKVERDGVNRRRAAMKPLSLSLSLVHITVCLP